MEPERQEFRPLRARSAPRLPAARRCAKSRCGRRPSPCSHYLATHPGRLVGKEELFAAVWPNLVVTDDTLVQSIGELRRALGDTGRAPDHHRAEARLSLRRPARRRPTVASRASGMLLRWRWKYGILAPLAWSLTLAVVVVRHARARGPRNRRARGRQARDRGTAFPEPERRPRANISPTASRRISSIRWGVSRRSPSCRGTPSPLYKGAAAQPGEIARALAVRYQVEGSVRYAGDQVRVSAQLVDDAGPSVVVRALRRNARRRVRAAGSHHARDRRRARDPRDRVRTAARRRESRPRVSMLTTTCCARGPRCSARRAAASSRRASCCARRSRSTRDTPPRIRRSAKPSMSPYPWAGRSFPTNTGNASRNMPARRCSSTNRDVRARILLARSYIAYNRYTEAEAQIDRAIAINPSDADALAGRGNILMWLGETDAAIESLELAQRIDPELNDFDRFALALAYYLKTRLRRRHRAGRAQPAQESAERASTRRCWRRPMRRRAGAPMRRAWPRHPPHSTPRSTRRAFGNKFLNPNDLEHLREGLRKAGLIAPSRGASVSAAVRGSGRRAPAAP